MIDMSDRERAWDGVLACVRALLQMVVRDYLARPQRRHGGQYIETLVGVG